MLATSRESGSRTELEQFYRLIESGQFMLFQFFAQCIAINSKDIRCFALIAADVSHDGFQQRTLDLGNDHVVYIGRFFAIEIIEISLHRGFNARGDGSPTFFHAASLVVCNCAPKNSRTMASCCPADSTRLTRFRNTDPPVSPLLYQEICLRATRTPVCSP